jgi:PAS domain S-box-containing protein
MEAARLASLLAETTHRSVLVLDADQRVAYLNRRLAEILGCPGEDLRGRDGRDLFEAGSWDALQTLVSAGRDSSGLGLELALRRRDGTQVARPATAVRDGGELLILLDEAGAAGAGLAVALQKVTAALGRAVTPADVAEVGLGELHAVLGIDSAVLAVIEERTHELIVLRALGTQPNALEALGQISLDAALPLAEAARSGDPVWLPGPEEAVARYPALEPYAAAVGGSGSIPLLVEGRVIGALGLTFRNPRRLTADERMFASTVAQQCAQALQRARLYQQLDDVNQKLSAVIQASPAAIILLDRDSTVRLWNPAAELIFGWAAAEVLDRPCAEVPPDRRAELAAMLAQVIDEGTPVTGLETVRLRKGGAPFDVAIFAAPVRFPHGGQQCLAVVVDVSERKRAEAALRASEEQAKRAYEAARMADRRKDEFLAILGHELRNPLSPILTAVELMKLRRGPAAEHERDVIERQVRHLVRLVDDLLDVSRITRGQIELTRERLEVSDVVAQAIELASPLLELRAHSLRVAIPRDGLAVDGDQTRLVQVFTNLLTNAAKYTPRGGCIAVGAVREGDEVVVHVRDNGPGIPADLLPHVFDLFVQGTQTLDRREGGLGIGLTLVRSLVKLHGGSVSASCPGPEHGSDFAVRLPLSPPAPRTLRAPYGSGGHASIGHRLWRILLVDDNIEAAEVLAEGLRMLGHDVVIAHDGPAALELSGGRSFDVALLDIGLPVMDGYELARRLRTQAPGMRLVAVTGYGQEGDVERARQAGFAEHLVKPVDLDRLTRAMRPGRG